jgi:hypothetical protein
VNVRTAVIRLFMKHAVATKTVAEGAIIACICIQQQIKFTLLQFTKCIG